MGSEAFNMSPFFMLYDYHPQPFPLVTEPVNAPTLEQRIHSLEHIWSEAAAAHELARQRMIERRSGPWTEFQKGDKFWLEATNLNLKRGPRKLAPKREGPFKILERIGRITY